MKKYFLIDRHSAGMVTIQGPRGRQLWATGKLRKAATCLITQQPIPKGTTVYRPVGNAWNRAERISPEGMEALEPK